MGRNRTVEPKEVEAMVAEGKIIVVFEELVLRLDTWIDKHPGGRLAILHMVGRDATDEIKAYHSERTLRSMRAYRIGRKPPGPWIQKTPPIRAGIYHEQASSADKGCYSDAEGDIKCNTDSRISSECSFVGSGHNKGCVKSIRNRSAASSAHGTMTFGANVPNLSRESFIEQIVQCEAGQDGERYPSIDSTTQLAIAHKYRALHQQIRDNGLYDCPYLEYGKELVRYIGLFVAFIIALRSGWFMVSAVFLGLFWHQIMFTAHDAGHLSITQNFMADTLIAIFIADFCCGLSMGWWKSSHNVHHLVTNHPEHDPDIQNVPLFATCPSFFKSIHSTYYDFTFVWDAVADFMVPYQKYTYYPIMGIARFNLYLLSWLHVLSSKSSCLGNSKAWWIRPTEIAFMGCYWFLFGYCLLWRSLPTYSLRVAFVLVSHIVTMPLHVQITLSHWGMSTSDLAESESFPQRQLRTTMDVDCPVWLDFIHGGLQFQAVHHLFPRVPRHNLRKVQSLVRQFCQETGIPYSILRFLDGNRKVLNRLQDVGDQVKLLVKCQNYMAETGESGLL